MSYHYLSTSVYQKVGDRLSTVTMNVPDRLPKLVVFDLDYTLWPFWVDTHVSPPFRKSNGNVVDMMGVKIKFYPDVPNILQTLKQLNILVGVASRTSEIEGANQLIDLFGWEEYFWQKEIYPGSKVAHFKKFHQSSGIPYEEMLFFDDENRNIVDLKRMNVTSILVQNGMNMKELLRDYTLWPFWVDSQVSPPFKKSDGKIVDMMGKKIKFYSDVPKILQTLKKLNIPVGVASRTSGIEEANSLIYLFGWEEYFCQKEIYPGCKIAHFEKFHHSSGIPYEEMLFFDDETRNIVDLQRMNVKSILVKKGMTLKEFQRGLKEFAAL